MRAPWGECWGSYWRIVEGGNGLRLRADRVLWNIRGRVRAMPHCWLRLVVVEADWFREPVSSMMSAPSGREAKVCALGRNRMPLTSVRTCARRCYLRRWLSGNTAVPLFRCPTCEPTGPVGLPVARTFPIPWITPCGPPQSPTLLEPMSCPSRILPVRTNSADRLEPRCLALSSLSHASCSQALNRSSGSASKLPWTLDRGS